MAAPKKMRTRLWPRPVGLSRRAPDDGCVEFAVQGEHAGWFRLRLSAARSAGPFDHRAEFWDAAGSRSATISLPFAINGQLDHFFVLPFAPRTFRLSSPQPLSASDLDTLCLWQCPPPFAWAWMLLRVVLFLGRQGSLRQLRAVGRWFDEREVTAVVPQHRVALLYSRIKLLMLHRSIPIREYGRWRAMQAEAMEGLVRKQWEQLGATTASVSVILDVRSTMPSAVQATVASLEAQLLPAAAIIAITGDVPEPTGNGVPLPCPKCTAAKSLAQALDAARTPFVLQLEPGVALAPEALVLAEAHLRRHPETTTLYFDEDEVESDGTHVSPLLKPDFDPVLQLTSGYIGANCVHSTPLLRRVSAAASEGRTTRCVLEREAKVHHLAHVLVHRSRAACPQNEPPNGPDHDSDPRLGVLLGGEPEHAGATPPVSIIIPTRDNPELIGQCVRSLRDKTAYPDFDIILVDNGSTDRKVLDLYERWQAEGEVRVVWADMPFNYSRLNNIGAGQARGEILVFLNNDTEVLHEGWLRSLTAYAGLPGVGTVGAKLLYADGRLQHGGVVVGLRLADHPFKCSVPGSPQEDLRLRHLRTVTASTGACLAVRREVYEAVGGLDESLAVAFNDIDLCLRIQQAGFRNLWTPEAVLVHHESISRGRPDTPAKRSQFEREKRFLRTRWGAALASDPYYNPNFSHDVEDGGLAPFPRHLRMRRNSPSFSGKPSLGNHQESR